VGQGREKPGRKSRARADNERGTAPSLDALSLQCQDIGEFLDSVPVALALSTTDGVILDANCAMLEAVGYESKSDFIRAGVEAHWFDLEDRQRFVQLVEEGAAKGYEARFRKKDGGVFWGSITSVGWRIGEQDCIVTYLLDITARKLAEERLCGQECYFHSLIDNAFDAIVVLGKNGEFLYQSPSVSRILGYTPDDVAGKPLKKNMLDFVHPEDAEMVIHDFEKLLSAPGETSYSRARYFHKEGSWRVVEGKARNLLDDPCVQGIVVNYRDVTESAEAEEALRKQERYFRAMIENSLDAVVVIDEEGRALYQSPSAERILGYKPEELIGKGIDKNAFELVHPDDIERITREFESLLSNPGGTSSSEARYLHKDGSWRILQGSAKNLLDDPSVNGVVANYRDVTERRLAEEELRQQERYFRSLIEGSMDVVLVINPDGTIRYESPSIERVTGYTPEERRGEGVLELIHPDDLPSAMGLLAGLLGGETGRIHTEMRLRHKDGSSRVVEAVATSFVDDPAVAGIVVNFRDITERVEAREALRRSEEYFRALIEKARDGIVVLDQDGTIRYQSPYLERVMGYQPGERTGQNPFKFIEPDDIHQLQKMFEELMQTPGAVVHGVRVHMRHKDGSRLTFEADATNLIENPIVAGIVVNCRDVTDRERAEQALRESEEKYRSLVERANDGITIVQDAVIKYANPRALEMVGYSPEEMIGKPLRYFIHPSEAPMLADRFQRVMSGDLVNPVYETVLIHKDGHPVDAELSGGVVTYQGRPADLVVGRDITERKKAEQALKESEEKYRSVVERANDGIAIVQDAVIKYANLRCSEILGYAPDEVVNTSMTLYIHHDELPEVVERYQRRMAGEETESVYETVLVDKEGRAVDVELNGGVVTYEGNPADLVVIRDITERKRAQEALRESQEKFRRLVEDMNDGYCVIQDSRVIFHNETSAQMFGYSPEELEDKAIQELLPAKILNELSKIHARRLRGEDVPAQYETILWRKDRSSCPVELSTRMVDYGGKPAVSVVVRDISERKQAEKALQRSEEKLKRYLESSPDAIYTIDLKGTFLYGNRAAERIVGYAKEELLGRTFLEANLLPDEYVERMTQLLELNARGMSTGPTVGEIIRKDGSRVFIEVSTYPIGEGDNIEIIGVARDVTERKRAEEEKQRMEEQLLLAGRLAAVGELAAGVAHELNNPLAAVQGFAQLLAERQGLDEAIRQDVETIHEQAQRASRITGNLLSFARRHKPEKSLVSINEVVERSLDLHAYRMRVSNIEVALKLDRKLPETMADFHQMQQVFVNLITNAEQAMTDAHGRGKLTIRTQRAGNTIRVSFTDDGPGIPEDKVTRIFDPFFTTKEVGKGTGLGLSICFGIVREHGGRLYSKSRVDRGTTFTVEIPIVSDESGSDSVAQTAESQPGGNLA